MCHIIMYITYLKGLKNLRLPPAQCNKPHHAVLTGSLCQDWQAPLIPEEALARHRQVSCRQQRLAGSVKADLST